jgi:SAM-dependent methyltransferase
MSSLLPSNELQLPSVAFFGRTFDEYLKFFSLDLPALSGRRVLDVAAGPASFAAEARDRGIDAVAADPMYGLPLDTLSAHVAIDYRRMLSEMRRNEPLLRYGYFPSFEAAELSRRSAAARFLADYETGFLQGRYVGASLPRLPFGDASFGLVLCAHLLFLYGDKLDCNWHMEACRELVRVSACEVRVHPVCGLGGRPYADLSRLQSGLAAEGIASEVRPVNYEFFAGTNSMLVLRRRL